MVGTEASNDFYITVGKNLRQHRKDQGLSAEALGNRIGVVKKTILRYEDGEAKFDMHRLADLAQALGISIVKLLAGTEAFLGERYNGGDMVRLPVLGFVPAGGPVMVEENIEGYIPYPRSMVKGDQDFALLVRGDSMEDVGIHDGDTVIVHPQPVAENGQTVIARVNGEVTCKRFYRQGDTCRLEPANNKYKPIACDNIEVIGIVKRVIKEVF